MHSGSEAPVLTICCACEENMLISSTHVPTLPSNIYIVYFYEANHTPSEKKMVIEMQVA